MRLTRYVVGSFVVAGGLVYHALKTREQYFPAMLYLSTSKLSVVVMGNLMFALTLCLGHLFKAIFLGQLREAEVERLYERSKDAIMETCLAMTIFREEFNVKFVVMFVTLLFVKIFHWLCSDRVEYVETSPSTTRLAHLRVCTLAACLLALDLTMLQYSVTETLRLGPSVLLLFGFEYIILASKVVATSCKYLIFAIDTWREGRWDEKGTYVFYLELVTDLLHLFVYFCFFVIIFAYYGLPIHLVRDLYMTFRNFNRRVKAFIQYRKVTANLHERFPDATTEELTALDDSCIICRDDMTADGVGGAVPKKLPCGHIFHLRCLRTWMERQQACPTCRAPVEPEDHNAEPRARDAREREVQAQLMNELFGDQPGVANQNPAQGPAAPNAQAAPQAAPDPAARPGWMQRRDPAVAADAAARRQAALDAVQRATAEAARAARGGTPPQAQGTPPHQAQPPHQAPHPFGGPPQAAHAHAHAAATAAAQQAAAAQMGGGAPAQAPGYQWPTPPQFPPQTPYQWPSPGASPYYFPPPLTPGTPGTENASAETALSPAQAHQIASATAAAIAAASAQAQLALFGMSPLGLLAPPPHLAGQIAGLGFPPGHTGGVQIGTPATAQTATTAAGTPASSASAGLNEDDENPQSVARRAAIRAQVSLLEAQVASLQAQLSAQSLEGSQSAGGGADENNGDVTKEDTEDGGKEEETNGEEEETNGEIVPAGDDVDSEAEGLRRRRLERFGANPSP